MIHFYGVQTFTFFARTDANFRKIFFMPLTSSNPFCGPMWRTTLQEFALPQRMASDTLLPEMSALTKPVAYASPAPKNRSCRP